MLSKTQKDRLKHIHSQTSLEVQAFIEESLDLLQTRDPWAEARLKAFLAAYARFGVGTTAYRYLVGGDHEQLAFEQA